MDEFIGAWQSRLDRDLRVFADRGTEPSFEVVGQVIEAKWQVRGAELDALFEVSPAGGVRWVSGPGAASYALFLKSDAVADFRRFATATTAMIDSRSDYVASEAIIDDGIKSISMTLAPGDLTSLADNAREHAEGLTTLFFLKGDAGAGKTTLLREATRRQAQRYLDGEADFLFFYVSAQGRELSNLRDAFSGELDDLHASFSREAVPILARNGVLVPVIDGFDELLGTAGYGGAFSSLQSLLGELSGLGTLVVSARSAFYDIEFMGTSGGRSTGADFMSNSTIALQPWTDDQLRGYLTRNRDTQDANVIQHAFQQLSSDDIQLLRRPFFASEFETFALKSRSDNSDSSLLDHLINAYIGREAEKIVNANGDPVLQPDGHRYLFELAVGYMWERGSRQLSVNDLTTIADLVSEEFGLTSDQALQLRTKITSYAGFSHGRGRDIAQPTFSFEHEVYFEYFLARAMRRLLEEHRINEILRFADRGIIPASVVREAVTGLSDNVTLDPSLFRCSTGITFENRRRNLGTLVLTFATIKPIVDGAIQNLEFIDLVAEGAEFTDIHFNSCQFVDSDLQSAHFAKCDARTSTFDSVAVNDDTILDVAGLQPGVNVRSLRHPQQGDVYVPEHLGQLLIRLGGPSELDSDQLPKYSEHGEALINLLQRVERVYRRKHILYESDEHLISIFRSPEWQELRALLIDHGIVSVEMREAQGANVPGLRLRINITDLMADQSAGNGAPPSSSSALWQALRSV